jgi:hypothetical protein
MIQGMAASLVYLRAFSPCEPRIVQEPNAQLSHMDLPLIEAFPAGEDSIALLGSVA